MNKDFKLGLIMTALCLFLWFYAIPYHIKGTTAALFPKFVVLFLLIPSILLLIKGRKTKLTEKAKALSQTPWRVIMASAALVLIMGVYIFLIDILGYYVSSFLAIVGFLLFLGTKRVVPLLVTPTAILLIVFVVIGKILTFPLPEGMFF